MPEVHHDLYERAISMAYRERDEFFRASDMPPRRLERILDIAFKEKERHPDQQLLTDLTEHLILVLADRYAEFGYTASHTEKKKQTYLERYRAIAYGGIGLTPQEIEQLKAQTAGMEVPELASSR